MASTALDLFSGNDLTSSSISTNNVSCASFKKNKKTGSATMSITFDNGKTHSQTITKTGVQIKKTVDAPKSKTKAERNRQIKDLHKNKMTQNDIAAICGTSQSTVSRVINKK